MRKKLSLCLAGILCLAQLTPVKAQTNDSIFPYGGSSNQRITGDVEYSELSDSLKGTLMATNLGLMFMDNEDFLLETPYPVDKFVVASDIDAGGINDVLISMESPDGQDNIALLSGETSTLLFSMNVSHQNVDSNNNVINENSTIQQMLFFEDHFYVIYDHHLLAFDTSGNILFDYEEEDNIWKMDVSIGAIVFTTQTGYLKCIDSKSGKIIWESDVASKLEIPKRYTDEMGSLQLNAWDLYVYQDYIFVTTEHGHLAMIDAMTGKPYKLCYLEAISEETLMQSFENQPSLDDYCPTGSKAMNFMSYQIQPIDENRFLITAYLGNPNFVQEIWVESKIPPVLMVYDIASQTVTSKMTVDNFNLYASSCVVTTKDNEEVIMLPVSSQTGQVRVNTYRLATGELIEQKNVAIPGVKESGEVILMDLADDQFIFKTGHETLYKVSKDLTQVQSVSQSKQVQWITTLEDGYLGALIENGITTKIIKYGTNGMSDILYECALPNEYLQNSNGFEAIQYDASTNRIYALIQTRNASLQVEASVIVEIDASNGSILQQRRVSLGRAYDENNRPYTQYLIGESVQSFADINKDGTRELLVDQMILNGRNYEVMSSYSPIASETGSQLEIGDTNNDGVSDIVEVTDTQATLYQSVIESNNIRYQKTNTAYTYAKDLQNQVHAKLFPDLDQDGVKELVINERNANGLQIYRVLDSRTLTKKYDLMPDGVYDWGESFQISDLDLNHDHVTDILYYSPDSTIDVISGQDGSTLFTFNQYPLSDYGGELSPSPLSEIIEINIREAASPLVFVEDQNEDGVEDIAFISSSYNQNDYSDYAELKIVSSSDYTEIKKVTIFDGYINNYALSPIENSTKLFYKTNDGKTQIFDYVLMSPVASFSLDIKEARAFSDHEMSIIMTDQGMYDLNDNCDFTIENIPQDTLTSGKQTFKWQTDKMGQMTILDQNEKVTTTNASEVTIDLLEGNHVLQFVYDDGHGKMTHRTIEVTVEEGHALNIVMVVVMLLTVAGLVGLMVYPKYRLKKKVGVDHE